MIFLKFTGLSHSSPKAEETDKPKKRISYPLESRDHHPGWPGLDVEKLRQPQRIEPGDSYRKVPDNDVASIRSLPTNIKPSSAKKDDIFFTLKPSRSISHKENPAIGQSKTW